MATLVEGCGWWEGLRLAHLHSRTDLLETHLKPGLLEGDYVIMMSLCTITARFMHDNCILSVINVMLYLLYACKFKGSLNVINT